MKAYKGWRYNLVKGKAYFEKGYGLTNYVKYVIALFGLSSMQVKATLIIATIYIPVCFLLGWWWFNHGWIFLETEVGNEFNWFVKEVRKKLK